MESPVGQTRITYDRFAHCMSQYPSLNPHLFLFLQRHASFSTALVRSHGRLVHKRSTLEILMRGKMVGAAETSLVYSHPHRFDKYNYTTPTYCDYCTNLLWGPVKVHF